MDAVVSQPMYGWNTVNWKPIQRTVFKLQKRIYRASQRGDVKRVRSLQRLLLKSRSAKLLAVRRVSQDNQGKKTAGVDGVKSLTPEQRLELVANLKLTHQAKPVRRVVIDKADRKEKRPLGIPTICDRALQALVLLALDPQWEARFDANSYGFRLGRSAWDAIGAIYVAINQKAKWVLDADIEKCFDRINHSALLTKIETFPLVRRQLCAWLKAGVIADGELFPTTEGTPQGGTLSPLLANIALNGMEEAIRLTFPNKRRTPIVIRYADDFAVIHPERSVIKRCQAMLSEWLAEMGLALKTSKTRIRHTLSEQGGAAGFDFLGFNIRQYQVKRSRLGFKTIIKPSGKSESRHQQQVREVIEQQKQAQQAKLIMGLNPIIRGWCRYFSTVCSKASFSKADYKLMSRLRRWIRFRHPNQCRHWAARKYWRREEGRLYFGPRNHSLRLRYHGETPIRRHVKVQSRRSPYEGDWVYWSARLGHHPEVSTRKAKLLKRQKGRCTGCGLSFTDGELIEVDHIIPKEYGGRDAYYNWQLLHGHCHDEKTREDRRRCV
jgi:RNA-directed DNA polymerase